MGSSQSENFLSGLTMEQCAVRTSYQERWERESKEVKRESKEVERESA